MHPLLMLSAGVALWAAFRQVPQARALAAAVRAAARELQEQKRKPPVAETPKPLLPPEQPESKEKAQD